MRLARTLTRGFRYLGACHGWVPAAALFLLLLRPPVLAQTTDLTLAKSGSDVLISMGGTSGPWRVVRSTTPHFNYQNVLLASAASSSPVTDAYACTAPALYFYDASDEGAGETPADQGQPTQENLYLTSLSPDSGWEGQSITINGEGFSAEPDENSVFFGPLRAVVTAATSTSLTVTVPVGVATGPVLVQVSALTSNSLTFKAVLAGGVSGTPFENISSIVFNSLTADATSSKHLFIADMGTNGVTSDRLWEVMNDYSLVARVSTWNELKGLPMDTAGNLYFANTTYAGNAGLVRKYDVAAQTNATYTNAKKYNETDSVSIVGLAIRPDGIVFAADRFHNSIRKRVPAQLGASDFVTGYTLDLYMGMAMDSAQTLYFTSGGTLYRTPTGGSASVTTVATGFTNASGIAIDESTGNVLILLADRGAGKVYMINADTGWKEEIASGLSSPRAVAFGEDKVSGELYYYVAEASRVLRLPDPEIRPDPLIATGQPKVLISKLGTTDSYPLAPLQSAPAQVKIRFEVTFQQGETSPINVYVKLYDPDDSFSMEPAGDNDNKDPAKNGGDGAATFQNCLSTNTVPIDPANPRGEVTLTITNQYAGDNYVVGFSFDPNFIAPGSTVSPRIRSAILTAWKRVYVEQDRMFKRGGLLFESYLKPVNCGGPDQPPCCGTGSEPACCGQPGALPCNQIKVYDWTNAVQGDTIVIFDSGRTAENAPETRTIQEISPPDAGARIITLNSQLPSTFIASEKDSQSPPKPTFQNYDFAAIGVPSQGYWQSDTTMIRSPYDDAFVEFITTLDGPGALPYLPDDLLSVYDYQTDCTSTKNDDRTNRLTRFSYPWFAHFGSSSNVFQLVGSACPPYIDPPCSHYEYKGVTRASLYHLSYVSQCACAGERPGYVAAYTQDVTCHELAHQFKVNECGGQNETGHDDHNAWCGTCGSTTGPEGCLMNEGRDPINNIIEFGVADMLGPRTQCPTYTEAAIRTHTDPIGSSREEEMNNAVSAAAVALGLTFALAGCATTAQCPPAQQEIRQLPFQSNRIIVYTPEGTKLDASWYFRDRSGGSEWTYGSGQISGGGTGLSTYGRAYKDPNNPCLPLIVDLADLCGLWTPGSYEIAALSREHHDLILGPYSLTIEEPQGLDKEVFQDILTPLTQDACKHVRTMNENFGIYSRMTNFHDCPPPMIRILQEYPTSTYAAFVVYDFMKGPSQSDPMNLIEVLESGSYLERSFKAPYENPQDERQRSTFATYWGEHGLRWRERWGNLVLTNHPDFRYADEIRLCLAVDQIALKHYEAAAQALDRLAKDDKSPMAQKAKEYLGFMKQKGWFPASAAASVK